MKISADVESNPILAEILLLFTGGNRISAFCKTNKKNKKALFYISITDM
jgi:hypothetical protein